MSNLAPARLCLSGLAILACLLTARSGFTDEVSERELRSLEPAPRLPQDMGRLGLFSGPDLGVEAKELLESYNHLEAGRSDQAIASIQAILAKKPNVAPAHELLGIAYGLQGDLKRSRDAIDAAIRLQPARASAYSTLGCLLIAQGEDKLARRAFLEALSRSPRDPRAHQRLGILDEKAGDIPSAIEHYQKGIVELPPGQMGVRSRLGRLYNFTGRHDEAIALLEPAVAAIPQDSVARQILGLAYLAKKELDKAIREFEQAADLSPPDPETPLVLLAAACRDRGDLARSLEILQGVIAVRKDWAAGHFQAGETCLKLKDLDRALEYYIRAAALSTAPQAAELRQAQVRIAQGKYDEAAEILQALVAVSPGFLEAQLVLGSFYQNASRWDEARKVFDAACARFPQSAEAHYQAGLFHGVLREYMQAVERLKKAAELGPSEAHYRRALSLALNRAGDKEGAVAAASAFAALERGTAGKVFLAGTYEDAGKDEEAGRLYREVLSTEPDSLIPLNNLSLLEAKAGRFEEALKLTRRAVALAPTNGAVRDSLGWILFLQGSVEEGIAELDKALALAPQSPGILLHLAKAHSKAGRRDKALDNARKALVISEDFPGASDARAMVRELSGR